MRLPAVLPQPDLATGSQLVLSQATLTILHGLQQRQQTAMRSDGGHSQVTPHNHQPPATNDAAQDVLIEQCRAHAQQAALAGAAQASLQRLHHWGNRRLPQATPSIGPVVARNWHEHRRALDSLGDLALAFEQLAPPSLRGHVVFEGIVNQTLRLRVPNASLHHQLALALRAGLQTQLMASARCRPFRRVHVEKGPSIRDDGEHTNGAQPRCHTRG